MQRHAITIAFVAVSLVGLGCGSKNASGSKSPNVIEQIANDVEHEADQADETAEKTGDDVEGAADDVVDEVD
jgi:hypothetical protein